MEQTTRRRLLTADEVTTLLSYDPASGEFTWKVRAHGPARWNTRYAGTRAGYSWTPRGSKVRYRAIRVNDYPYLAHRLAILIATGAWPPECVDHIDGDGENNRLSNLRLADRKQNAQNAGAKSGSQTGIRGVSPYNGKFRASFSGVTLGVFDTPQEAQAAYLASARLMLGDFVRE